MTIGLRSLDQARLRLPAPASPPAIAGGVLVSEGFHAGAVWEPAFEVTAPAMTDHLVVVTLSPRSRCEGEVDGRPWPVRFGVGTAVVLPAGTRSRWLHRDPGQVVHLLLDVQRYRLLLEGAGVGMPAPDPMILGKDFEFLRIAETVAREAAAPGAATRLFADYVCLAVALRLTRLKLKSGEAQPSAVARVPSSSFRLKRLIAAVDQRLADDLSLAELAAEAGMSPFHFARAFKAATGLPPHRYLMHRRIERAKALLVGTRLSVTEIAHACGFASSQHMAKVFRKSVGTTASGYREASR